MKAIQISLPASLENLRLVDLPDPAAPGPGEITVRLRASSLNYHDFAVVSGMLPCADGRIPMSDGAGEVVAVGAGVTDYQLGDLLCPPSFPIGWMAHRLRQLSRACRAMALMVMRAN